MFHLHKEYLRRFIDWLPPVVRDDPEKLAGFVLGTVGCTAILLALGFKEISGENILDAIKEIAGLGTILFVAVIAVRSRKDPADRVLSAGRSSLERLQQKYQQFLSGPKANRDNYDEDHPGKEYLFFQAKSTGQKAQLVPITPLREGIVEIRVPKTTLLILGYPREGLEQVQQDMLEKVGAAVKNTLEHNWKEKYEILTPKKKDDIAIVVDFDESKFRPKEFGKAVTECTETAVKILLEHKK